MPRSETPNEPAVAQARRDAIELGRHVKQGGWRLGLLVARSCRIGAGGRPAKNANTVVHQKLTLRQFAALSGMSKASLSRYYRAWEAAANDGHVPHAKTLVPGQECDIVEADLPKWSGYLRAQRGDQTNNDAQSNDAQIEPTETSTEPEVSINANTRQKAGKVETIVHFAVPTSTFKVWQKKAKTLNFAVEDVAKAATASVFDDM